MYAVFRNAYVSVIENNKDVIGIALCHSGVIMQHAGRMFTKREGGVIAFFPS